MLYRRQVPALVAIVALLLTLLPAGLTHAQMGVAEPFRDYYNQHQGMRVLGYPLTDLVEVNGYPAQYFEKGRLEDHRNDRVSADWAFMYGRLTAELMERDPMGSVTGTSVTYGTLQASAGPEQRYPVPPRFTGGVMAVAGGMFIPYDSQLRPVPGYIVPSNFWNYINRSDLFPGGWLHDIGLPMTNVITVSTYKNGTFREISMQAFERTVLTYDPQNPQEWQIERGNIGADAIRAMGLPIPPLPTPIPQPGPARIEIPARSAWVSLPLHLLVRVGNPGDAVVTRLRWQDGGTLQNTFTLLRGEDGRGLLIGNLDWVNMLQPPSHATQLATLEIRSLNNTVLASQSVTVVSVDDPIMREIKLFWVVNGAPTVQAQTRRIIKSERIGAAALEELLWGPPIISQVGFATAIPTPQEVLSYPGREPDWGPRVTLRSLTIRNGVATADFSQEMRAYGGGSQRVSAIREQITQTLLQFPTVREVRIAIEGQTEGVLEP